jgi:sodium transport system permease protein
MEKFIKLFKKELLSILRDKRAFRTFIIMTVFFTPLLFAVLGAINDFQTKQIENEQLIFAVDNKSSDSTITDLIRANVNGKIIDSKDFQKDLETKAIQGYVIITGTIDKLKAEYIYDQTSNSSTGSAQKVQSTLQQLSTIKLNQKLSVYNIKPEDLTPIVFESKTLQELQNKPAQNSFALFFLPYIIMVGLIQGASQFAIELTSGEKERNTLATTLSLNAPRSTIGLAKISAVLVMSFIGLILNISSILFAFKLFPSGFGGSEGATISITPTILFQLFVVLLPLSFLISSLLVLLGTYAKNAKEGQMFILPLIMGSVFIGFMAQAFDANTPTILFAIPLVGHVALIKQVLLGSFIPINYLISATSTLIIFVAILILCINMFKSEEVIFRK